uniref:Uncharacterized protein n=1 Tax=Caenorhabditis japonica TaxID=281687 RepID=A0A8R1DS82_CAEJA
MLSLLILSLSLSLLFSLSEAGPYGLRNGYQTQYPTGRYSYGNYQYQYPSNYNQQYYRNGYYQGYRTPYQYQYQGYGNYYATPAPVRQSLWPGVNIDSNGNSYIGTKENGIYLFCNGRGCPGRG